MLNWKAVEDPKTCIFQSEKAPAHTPKTYFSEKKKLIKEKKDFPLETFVKIGRKLSQDDIYYTENKEYVILYKKKLN